MSARPDLCGSICLEEVYVVLLQFYYKYASLKMNWGFIKPCVYRFERQVGFLVCAMDPLHTCKYLGYNQSNS